MTRIQIKSRVGPDGVLTLKVPLGREEADREVIVNVESAGSGAPGKPSQEEWERFVDGITGSITDSTFRRHEQGEFEERESLP